MQIGHAHAIRSVFEGGAESVFAVAQLGFNPLAGCNILVNRQDAVGFTSDDERHAADLNVDKRVVLAATAGGNLYTFPLQTLAFETARFFG